MSPKLREALDEIVQVCYAAAELAKDERQLEVYQAATDLHAHALIAWTLLTEEEENDLNPQGPIAVE